MSIALKVIAYFVILSASEGSKFFAEPVLSAIRFFATLRMTGAVGKRPIVDCKTPYNSPPLAGGD